MFALRQQFARNNDKPLLNRVCDLARMWTWDFNDWECLAGDEEVFNFTDVIFRFTASCALDYQEIRWRWRMLEQWRPNQIVIYCRNRLALLDRAILEER